MSEKAERLMEEALTYDHDSRAAFIEAETVGDAELRSELMSLVSEADSANEFFDRLGHAIFSAPISIDSEAVVEARVRDAELGEGEMVGRYEIISLVGRGGMGTVYRARDTRLDRDVALKFLSSSLAAYIDGRDRLLSEARAAAALDHPNVCAIHEIGETPDDRLFIAMRFYEGETLKNQLRRGTLPIENAVAIAIQIARGLTAAHSRKIIHRDVKPGNMIVGPDGTVHLLDFGLAVPIDANLQSTGPITPGTVAYMSPEHARGDPVDQRGDLWSLGVVLYEMLAGLRPFRAESARAMLQGILHDDPEPIRKLRPEIPPALASVVDRLLQKEPANRYQTGADVLADLESVSASLSRPVDESRKKRSRVGFTVVAVFLFGLLGVSLWLRSRNESGERVGSAATRNVAAYELYRRGIDPVLLRSDSGVREAFAHLQQAIALDTNFAAAYSGLARLYLRIGFGGDSIMSRRERLALADAAALKGVKLDSMSGDAHLALAMVKRSNYEMKAAEAEMLKAVALDPTNAVIREKLAFLYVLLGRPSDALKQARRGVELDPLSASAHAEIANALMASGRCDDALLEVSRLRSTSPPLLRAGAIAAQCYAREEKWNEAVAEARRIIPNGGSRAQAILGYMLGRSGQPAEARKLLDELVSRSERTHGDAFDVAVVYAGLNDMNHAFEWLQKSVDDRSFGFEWLSVIEADFRRDSRFLDIGRRTGIAR